MGTGDFVLGEEDDSIAAWTELPDVLVVVLDVLGFGGWDEEFFLDFDAFFFDRLHLRICNWI